jgi:hypothetical protein
MVAVLSSVVPSLIPTMLTFEERPPFFIVTAVKTSNLTMLTFTFYSVSLPIPSYETSAVDKTSLNNIQQNYRA